LAVIREICVFVLTFDMILATAESPWADTLAL